MVHNSNPATHSRHVRAVVWAVVWVGPTGTQPIATVHPIPTVNAVAPVAADAGRRTDSPIIIGGIQNVFGEWPRSGGTELIVTLLLYHVM
mmetsp:Transcript_66139/g.144488  ORF Transcript_66139/g.144488 Transcript_66139/m.144488 type:complete len:90 (-) Transcript_66139:366-635(-)